MDKTKIKALVPTYFKEFNCIGPACEDTCCAGWSVNIDKSTYQKYKKFRSDVDEELHNKFDQFIKRDRSADHNDHKYASIKLDNNNYCPFLDEKGLCDIQKNLGSSYLSETCNTYPRTINKIDGRYEISCVTSCPEIVRVGLLNKDGIDFEEVSLEINKFNTTKSIDTNSEKNRFRIERYLWDLRIFSIKILQNRDYSLDERMIILTMFFNKLNENAKSDDKLNLGDLIDQYEINIESGAFKESLLTLEKNRTIQMKLIKELADSKLTMGATHTGYVNVVIETINGLGYASDRSIDEIGEGYSEVIDSYYDDLTKNYGHILENYLVNYVYRELIPFNGDNILEGFSTMAIMYSILKLHILGVNAFRTDTFCEADIVNIIQTFTKAMEHSAAYKRKIIKLLNTNDMLSLPYISIMLNS